MVRDAERTKNKIMLAALRVFMSKGYEGASLNEIARTAGVTKGGLYHHFESKACLFREALRFITEEMGKWSIAHFRRCRSSRSLVKALLGSMGEMKDAFSGIVGKAGGRPRYTFLEILVSAARRDSSIREEMGNIYDTTRRNIAGELRRGQGRGEIRQDIDMHTLAFEINALIEGSLLLSILDESVDLGRVGRQLFANIWRQISTSGE